MASISFIMVAAPTSRVLLEKNTVTSRYYRQSLPASVNLQVVTNVPSGETLLPGMGTSRPFFTSARGEPPCKIVTPVAIPQLQIA
jgi:hypothetical protein